MTTGHARIDSEEDASSTLVGRDSHTQRVSQVYELLRAELEPFVHPKMLTQMLDQCATSVANVPTDEVLREMRSAVAGLLLGRVGQFLVQTQPDPSARLTVPSRPPRAVA